MLGVIDYPWGDYRVTWRSHLRKHDSQNHQRWNTAIVSSEKFSADFIKNQSANASLFPFQIYENLLQALQTEFRETLMEIPSKKAVTAIIKKHRGDQKQPQINQVEVPSLCLTRDGKIMLRRNWFGDIKGVYHRIVIWATDDALALLRYEGHTFIDATFRLVSTPFKQCIIIMTFDAGTNMFVPCVYALMTGKNKYLYCTFFHEVIVLLNYKWIPKIITVDFEKALRSAVQYEFSESHIVGCHFHFKQAIRRKMGKFALPHDECHLIISALDLLTIVQEGEIDLAILYIIEQNGEMNERWQQFWAYFKRTWIVRFSCKFRKISLTKDLDLAGKTNNCIEHYNRRINDKFVIAHPNIAFYTDYPMRV